MNRECRNCAHLDYTLQNNDWQRRCRKLGIYRPLDEACDYFRPYTEKGEEPRMRQPSEPPSDNELSERDFLLWKHRVLGAMQKGEDRLKALEEDEGHARASRLLHGAEILKALDRIRAIEDRLGLLDKKAPMGWIGSVEDRLDKLESMGIARRLQAAETALDRREGKM